LANQVWTGVGLADSPHAWLAETTSAWATVIVADVWKTTPFVALLLLAALTNIDRRLYEAAAIDGAHRLQQLWYITLPALLPTLLVVLLFRSLDALKVFDLVYTLTHGGPGTSTEPLALYTFDTFFSHLKFGQGAALGVVSVVLAALFTLPFLRWMRLGKST
jgi:ABC-type sugar transport system permease subunit